MIRTILAGTAAVAVALTGAGPVSAAGSRRTQLTLSYEADAGYAAAVVLRCDPPGGGHPKAARACSTLRRAGGRPANLKPTRRMCMMIYAPLTARINGVWKGTAVDWSQRYGNACEMTRATGALFQF